MINVKLYLGDKMTQFWQEEKDKKKPPCNKQGWPIFNDIVHAFRGGGKFENIRGKGTLKYRHSYNAVLLYRGIPSNAFFF